MVKKKKKKDDDAALAAAVSDTSESENNEPAAAGDDKDKLSPFLAKKAAKKLKANKAKFAEQKAGSPESAEKFPPDKGPPKAETKNVTITDSINPFAPASASTATSTAASESTVETEQLSGIPPASSDTATEKEGPIWKRVSTRQWIRDFRDHVAKYQAYPYKSICKMCFWTFGYYPDMVSKYYPLTNIRHSFGSAEYFESAFTGSSTTNISGFTSADYSAVTGSTTDTNMNKPKSAAKWGKKAEEEKPAGTPATPSTVAVVAAGKFKKGAMKKGGAPPPAPAEGAAVAASASTTEISATETSDTETESAAAASKPKPAARKGGKKK